MTQPKQAVTIQEMAATSGLSEHTLRYYEKAGLITEVGRDPSTGRRRYSQDAADSIQMLACLRASGMGIKEMREYTQQHDTKHTATARKELFMKRQQDLAKEIELLKLKYEYAKTKVAYHTALEQDDKREAERILKEANAITAKISGSKKVAS